MRNNITHRKFLSGAARIHKDYLCFHAGVIQILFAPGRSSAVTEYEPGQLEVYDTPTDGLPLWTGPGAR